jgi:hypothetical protein
VSLRGRPVEQDATLPDGRAAVVWVGVPDDPYVAKNELETVSLELRSGEDVLATVNTVLAPEHVSEARALAREVASGLASGEIAPTGGALEPFAGRIPSARETP